MVLQGLNLMLPYFFEDFLRLSLFDVPIFLFYRPDTLFFDIRAIQIIRDILGGGDAGGGAGRGSTRGHTNF